MKPITISNYPKGTKPFFINPTAAAAPSRFFIGIMRATANGGIAVPEKHLNIHFQNLLKSIEHRS
jgi:hypothetical protein